MQGATTLRDCFIFTVLYCILYGVLCWSYCNKNIRNFITFITCNLHEQTGERHVRIIRSPTVRV